MSDENKEFDAQIELTKIGAEAVPALINALHSENRNTRTAVILILRDIHDNRAVDPLIDIYINDKDWSMRQEAEGALKNFGISKENVYNITKNKQSVAINETANVAINQAKQAIPNDSNMPKGENSTNNNIYIIAIILLLILAGTLMGLHSNSVHTATPHPNRDVPNRSPNRTIILEDDDDNIVNLEYERNLENITRGRHIAPVYEARLVPEFATCLCRAKLRTSLNEFGGTVQCNHCGVFQHLECSQNLNGGRCINEACNRHLT